MPRRKALQFLPNAGSEAPVYDVIGPMTDHAGPCISEEAKKCRHRFVRNRDKLFTFLSHDGIPWHNNNVEHAIKAFSKLRDITRGSFTERTVKNNTILLSICQTCKYSNLEFFEFIRSGATDIYTFAEKLTRRRRLPA